MMYRILLAVTLLFSVNISSADTFEATEQDPKYKDFQRQSREISAWLKQQKYTQSSLLFVLASSLEFSAFPVAETLQALNDAAGSEDLSKATWFRMALFCNVMQTVAKPDGEPNPAQLKARQYDNWCQENNILQRYSEIDPDNAMGYLFLMDFEADQPYKQTNRKLFDKAATAGYMTKYYGYNLQALATHLREYYRLSNVDSKLWRGIYGHSGDEDDFVAMNLLLVTLSNSPGYGRIFEFCTPKNKTDQLHVDEEIVTDCLRLAKLLDSDKNTLMETSIANAMIAEISQPGSEEQLEAERRRLFYGQVTNCIYRWSAQYGDDSPEVKQRRIFFMMLPLLEKFGEVEAMAIAYDQYYQQYLSKAKQPPSSCLLLKEPDLAAAGTGTGFLSEAGNVN